jgi:hypothetical protein
MLYNMVHVTLLDAGLNPVCAELTPAEFQTLKLYFNGTILADSPKIKRIRSIFQNNNGIEPSRPDTRTVVFF